MITGAGAPALHMMATPDDTEPTRPLPRGPHKLPREEVERSQRDRILWAMAEVSAAEGYANVSVADVLGRAGYFGVHDTSSNVIGEDEYNSLPGYTQLTVTLNTGSNIRKRESLRGCLIGGPILLNAGRANL